MSNTCFVLLLFAIIFAFGYLFVYLDGKKNNALPITKFSGKVCLIDACPVYYTLYCSDNIASITIKSEGDIKTFKSSANIASKLNCESEGDFFAKGNTIIKAIIDGIEINY